MLLDMYQVWDILCDVALGSCLNEVCVPWCIVIWVEDVLLCIAGSKCWWCCSAMCQRWRWLTHWQCWMLQFYDIEMRFFYIFVNIFLNDCNSYCGKILWFFQVLSFHSYIEIFQCENKFMIFLQRFTVPDVSMTAYAGFDEA